MSNSASLKVVSVLELKYTVNIKQLMDISKIDPPSNTEVTVGNLSTSKGIQFQTYPLLVFCLIFFHILPTNK